MADDGDKLAREGMEEGRGDVFKPHPCVWRQ